MEIKQHSSGKLMGQEINFEENFLKQMKLETPKPMTYNEKNTKSKIYSNQCLSQQSTKISNTQFITAPQRNMKRVTQISKRKETIKIRAK
jgi:hypothetical protein